MLRGFAALIVVFSHYTSHWDQYLGGLAFVVPQDFGYYAVKLFFVISGFVIYMTLDRCTTVVDFAVFRLSRLYPVYWSSLLLVTLASVAVFGQRFWPGGLIINATMFQEFLGYQHADVVYWSLSVELAFYLNVALLFGLGVHRRVYVIVFAWLALSLIWLSAAHGLQQVTTHGLKTAPRDWSALLFGFDYSPYFSIGILSYHAYRNGWNWRIAVLIALAIGVEFALASFSGVIIACVVALVVTLAIRGHLRFLVSRVTLWLGGISYSLYLIHRNLGYFALDWLSAHGVGPVPAMTIVTVSALGLATALTYAVERPALTLVRAWYQRSPARPHSYASVA